MDVNAREKLAINLTAESKAYGYTLCIWGSGAILVGAYGASTITVTNTLLYVLGAVAGFAVLVLGVYGSLFSNVTNLKEETLLAATMIHLIAAPLTVGLAYPITQLISIKSGFFLVGVNATVSYNIFLLVESLLYQELGAVESALFARG